MYSKITTDSSYSHNNQFKTLILGRMLIISVIFTLFFAILDTLNINDVGDIQVINNYLHAAFVFPVYVLFKNKKVSLNFTARYFLFFCFMTSSTALLFSENDSFRPIWFFLSTIIAFVFLGKKIGKTYGYGAMIFIAIAGFVLDSNINTESTLSCLIALLVLILITSAYSGHMHKHLERTERIQQELYYLANKSDIFNSLASDKKSSEVDLLLKSAQLSNNDFSLVYIEVNHDNLTTIKHKNDTFFIEERNKKLIKILKNLISSSDVISSISDNLLYIASPDKNEVSIKLMVNKIALYFKEYGLTVNNEKLNLLLSISITTLQPTDISMRALHIRADQGLTKIKSSDQKNIIFVDV